MNYIIIGKGYISELVTQINVTVNILSENEFKDSNLTIKTDDIVYAPTESALEIILERSEDSVFTNAVNMLKDKYKFRELMSNLYPDFFFAKTTINELEKVKLDREKKYMVKPIKGFFGTAVKELNRETNISEITKEIRSELADNTRYFSESVLSNNELIIEQFVEGEEYAVDMYFDEDGKPEIMNIYHHPLPEKIAYFNLLYYTNHQIFDKLYDRIKQIFIELNKHLNIADFPIHAEFKLENDKLIPIEMNPLRYGGFGLADLTFHAFGFNPFDAFFQNFQPDWNKIWKKHKQHHFGWVLGYNGKDINTDTHTPDDDAYLKYLRETLHYVEIDHRKNPVFSLAYVKDDSEISLRRLLKTNFNEFFVPVKKGM